MVNALGQWFPDYPGQTPQMDPQFVRMQQYQQAPAQQQPTMYGLPTIDARIIQVQSVDTGMQLNTPAEERVLMQVADDSAFLVKMAHNSGPADVDVYVKQPREAIKPPYVTWDALAAAVGDIKAAIAGRDSHEPVRAEE